MGVEKECRRYQNESGSIIELAVDIRGFNPVARSLLRRFRTDVLCRADFQVGLTIQGCSDDELPEQLFGVVFLQGLNLSSGLQVETANRTAVLPPPAANPQADRITGVSPFRDFLFRFRRPCCRRRTRTDHSRTL